MSAFNLPPGVTTADVSGPAESGRYRISISYTRDLHADDAGQAVDMAEAELPPDAENIKSEAEFLD